MQQWSILQDVPGLTTKPLVAFRRSKNIKDWVMHSDYCKENGLKSVSLNSQSTISGLAKPKGFHPCGNCTYCRKAVKTLSFHDEYRKELTSVSDFLNCKSTSVIYVITCPCNKKYIGKTTRPLKTRIGEHLCNLRHSRAGAPLVKHFMEQKHEADSLRFWAIERVSTSALALSRREIYWILSMRTLQPQGMNESIDWKNLE